MNEKTTSVRSCPPELVGALEWLRFWVEERDYAGYEPYDLLNSPRFSGLFAHATAASAIAIQAGRRFAGERIRALLGVPHSKNPKAIGLFLAGYAELSRHGADFRSQAAYLRDELCRLRDPSEKEFSWGYDWDFISLRGSVMTAFRANAIATVFAGESLMDSAETFGDAESEEMASSAARFCISRLNRSYESPDKVCFSYTPQNRTLIFNNSVLVGAFLARVGMRHGNPEFVDLGARTMRFLAAHQRDDGSWTYGVGRMQQWVDGFHTGYNLSALAAYRRHTGDTAFDATLIRGYEFYKSRCFTSEGIPKYFAHRVYPIDIHACTQALITFCDFVEEDAEALGLAVRVARWMISNMRSEDGFFYYQRGRFRVNRTPYMRWSQAWVFRALARLISTIRQHG